MKTAGGIAGEQIVLDPERLRALVKTMAETRAELARLRSSIGTIAFMFGEESPTSSNVPATEDWLEFEARDILRQIAALECRNVNYDFVIDTLGISSRQRLEATAQLVLQRLIDALPEEPIDAHTAVDMFGLTPIAGDYVDGAHAVWYAAEGDWTNALWSGVSVVPFLGSLIGQSLKHSDELIPLRHLDSLSLGLNRFDAAELNGWWQSPAKLKKHLKHLDEFGFTNKDDYTRAALAHLVQGIDLHWPTKIDKAEGTIRIYNPRTNVFGSYRLDDARIRTFFKPNTKINGHETNWDYWLSQRGKEI